MTIVFGTGHRPEDLEIDYSNLNMFIEDALEHHNPAVTVAVCGMAAGFDLAFGMAALNLDIDVWSVRPWAGHRPRKGEERRYDWIELNASKRIVTNDSLSYPGPWVYDVRNRWMVDHSEAGISFWNGKKNGGTYNCVEYAKSVECPVTNIYPR